MDAIAHHYPTLIKMGVSRLFIIEEGLYAAYVTVTDGSLPVAWIADGELIFNGKP